MARLEKIKAKLANEEYKRITRNVNTQVWFPVFNTKMFSLLKSDIEHSKCGISFDSRKSTAVERWQKSDYKVGQHLRIDNKQQFQAHYYSRSQTYFHHSRMMEHLPFVQCDQSKQWW